MGRHHLCCDPFACLYAARINAPVMEPGAASGSTYCLPGERAKGHPSAGSWRVNTCCHSMSCFGQCAHPWKLPLHALQTLFPLQRFVACFAMPLFSPSPPFPAGADVLAAPHSICPLQHLPPAPGTSCSWRDCRHPDTPSCCRKRIYLGPQVPLLFKTAP